jgi:hypothetical protein
MISKVLIILKKFTKKPGIGIRWHFGWCWGAKGIQTPLGGKGVNGGN